MWFSVLFCFLMPFFSSVCFLSDWINSVWGVHMEHYKYTKLAIWEYSRRVNWQNLKRSLPKMSPWEKKWIFCMCIAYVLWNLFNCMCPRRNHKTWFKACLKWASEAFERLRVPFSSQEIRSSKLQIKEWRGNDALSGEANIKIQKKPEFVSFF